jgi:uncharacterized membrane protein
VGYSMERRAATFRFSIGPARCGATLALIALLTLVLTARVFGETPGDAPTPGEPFPLPGRPPATGAWYVLDRDSADVTGDGLSDTVFLIGAKDTASAAYSRETLLAIQDPSIPRLETFPPGPITGGYEGGLVLGDFNCDGVADILAALPTGGSGGMTNYCVLSFKSRFPSVVFEQEELSRGARFSVTFQDGFAVSVFNAELLTTTRLSLRPSAQEYVEVGVYSEAGELLKKTTGLANPYSLLHARDIDGDDCLELIGFQRIWGLYHADTLGYARSVWDWSGEGWVLADAYVAAPGEFYVGLYTAMLPSQGMLGGEVSLALQPGGRAELARESAGGQPPTKQTGEWTYNQDGTITVAFGAGDGRDTIRFHPRGDDLAAVSYDPEAWGPGEFRFLRLTTDVPSHGGEALRHRGDIVLGPAVQLFTPCGSEEQVWVTDRTGELWSVYDSLSTEPYEPVFVEVLGYLTEGLRTEPAADYARQLIVTEVLRAAHEGFGCEEELAGLEFKARGVEPFWNVKISEQGISFFELSLLQVDFPYAPPAIAADRYIYYTKSEGAARHWLLVVIDRQPCADPMSGELSAYSAEVLIDGQRFTGCATKGFIDE